MENNWIGMHDEWKSGKKNREKRARKKGEGIWNRKIKEEERRKRNADDDNESGQSTIEQGERRKRRKIALEYERGDKSWKESEMVARRDYLTIPSREVAEVLIRNVGDYLHGMRSSTPLPPISPSFFSRFYPLSFLPLIRLFLLVSFFLYFVFLFLSFCLNPRFSLFPFSFLFLILPFFCYSDLLHLAFISINLSLF